MRFCLLPVEGRVLIFPQQDAPELYAALIVRNAVLAWLQWHGINRIPAGDTIIRRDFYAL